MLADEIKATESTIKRLEAQYLRELSEIAGDEKGVPRTAEPEGFRSAARVAAYMTSVEIEKEKHKLINQLYRRLSELEKQIASQGTELLI